MNRRILGRDHDEKGEGGAIKTPLILTHPNDVSLEKKRRLPRRTRGLRRKREGDEKEGKYEWMKWRIERKRKEGKKNIFEFGGPWLGC